MERKDLLGIGVSPGKACFTLGGFADEAADSIEEQIDVTRALGWKYIEARSVDGTNIHDVSDEAFLHIQKALERNGIGVSCFGSTIANWGTSVEEDLSVTMRTVRRAIERMKALDVKLIRIMSYSIITDSAGIPLSNQRFTLRMEHLRTICSEFLERDMIPVHENCFNYGGMSVRHSKELLAAIPGLKLVFDTGNPCLTPDFSKPEPWPNQEAWPSWLALKAHVAHLHIKDGWRDVATGKEAYVFPGNGPCQVARILGDCVQSGYRGFLSIEPHMAAVYHDPRVHATHEDRRSVYIEYGKRIEAMLRNLGMEIRDGVAYAQ